MFVQGKSYSQVLRSFGIIVRADATPAELSKARKKALVKYHPDRAVGRGAPWEKVVEAEEIYKLLQVCCIVYCSRVLVLYCILSHAWIIKT